MFDFIQIPFFWAGISLLGLLGANTAVITRFGKRFRLFGQLSGLLFSIGRIIMVLPFVSQPRLDQSIFFSIGGILLGIASLVFVIPGMISQPLLSLSLTAKKHDFERKK